jgi:hypothetical protein
LIDIGDGDRVLDFAYDYLRRAGRAPTDGAVRAITSIVARRKDRSIPYLELERVVTQTLYRARPAETAAKTEPARIDESTGRAGDTDTEPWDDADAVDFATLLRDIDAFSTELQELAGLARPGPSRRD